MGAQILRTSDLDDLAVMVADRVTANLVEVFGARLSTEEQAARDLAARDATEAAIMTAVAGSADAQENGEPAQADAQSEPEPGEVVEVSTPAPAKTAQAKAKGKAQPDLLGLGGEEDDE